MRFNNILICITIFGKVQGSDSKKYDFMTTRSIVVISLQLVVTKTIDMKSMHQFFFCVSFKRLFTKNYLFSRISRSYQYGPRLSARPRKIELGGTPYANQKFYSTKNSKQNSTGEY